MTVEETQVALAKFQPTGYPFGICITCNKQGLRNCGYFDECGANVVINNPDELAAFKSEYMTYTYTQPQKHTTP